MRRDLSEEAVYYLATQLYYDAQYTLRDHLDAVSGDDEASVAHRPLHDQVDIYGLSPLLASHTYEPDEHAPPLYPGLERIGIGQPELSIWVWSTNDPRDLERLGDMREERDTSRSPSDMLNIGFPIKTRAHDLLTDDNRWIEILHEQLVLRLPTEDEVIVAAERDGGMEANKSGGKWYVYETLKTRPWDVQAKISTQALSKRSAELNARIGARHGKRPRIVMRKRGTKGYREPTHYYAAGTGKRTPMPKRDRKK